MRQRSAVLVLLVVAVLAATTAAASPRPVAVCQPCGNGFEMAAATGDNVPMAIVDADVAVTDSTATVRVYENGTADWTVRNELANASNVDFFREQPDALRDVATDAFVVGDAELLAAEVTDEGSVHLRYRVADFATRSNGVLRVDYFRERPGRYVFHELGADQLRLVGPEGTRVTTGLPGATVDGNELTATGYRDGGFVVFAPGGDPLSGVRTHGSIAAATWGVVLGNLLALVALPAGVVAAGTVAAGAAVYRGLLAPGRERARRIGIVVAAAGLALALYAALPADRAFVGVYAPWGVVGGVATAAVGGALAARPEGWTPRRLTGLVAGGILTGATAAGAGQVLLSVTTDRPLLWASLPAVIPLWMLVVGGARDAGRRRRAAVLAVPPAGFALAVLATRSLTTPGGPMFVLVSVLFVGYALLAIVAGLPLLALGAALPTDDEDGGARPPGRDHAVE